MTRCNGSIRHPLHHDHVGHIGDVGQVGHVDRFGERRPKIARFMRASEIPPCPTEWLWTDRIPYGNTTILEGVPGQAKSAVAYDLAARISVGLPMPLEDDSAGSPAGVVLLQGEDDLQSTVVPRLKAAMADLSRIIVIDRLVLPDELGPLKDAIREVNAKLVIIDPITSFFGPSVSNDQAARRVLTPLRQLAQRWDLAIILVRHVRKTTSGPEAYQGAGTVGIVGAARSVLRVKEHPSGQPFCHELTLVKSNLAAASPQPFRTLRLENGAIKVDWLPAPQPETPPPKQDLPTRSRLDEAVDFLYVTLGNGPVRVKDLFKAAKDNDISQRTLRRAKDREGVMISRKNLAGQKVASYWELPKKPTFSGQVVAVLKQLLDEARVIGTDQSPRVVCHDEQLIVVRSHLGGGCNLQIDVQYDQSSNRTKVVATDGKASIEIDLSDPTSLDQLRDNMRSFGLTWDSHRYAELTAEILPSATSCGPRLHIA